MVIAGHGVGAVALATAAILFASKYVPTPAVTALVPRDLDHRNRSLISRGFLWVSAYRRQSLLDHATPAERAAFVDWQHKLMLLFVVATAAIVGVGAVIHPASSRPTALPTAVSSAGAVKSIELHETSFSTTSTVTTDTGVYQVRGAVSASLGDVLQLKATPEDKRAFQMSKQELCVSSSIKTACYELR